MATALPLEPRFPEAPASRFDRRLPQDMRLPRIDKPGTPAWRSWKPGLAPALLLVSAMCLVGCGLRNRTTLDVPSSGAEAPDETYDVPGPVLEGSQGLFVQKRDAPDLEFIEWQSESTANAAVRSLRASGGGTVYFAPGRYVVRHGIFIAGIDNVALIAAPGVELVFPARGAGRGIQLTEPASEGQSRLMVDHTEGLSVGGRYQVFPEGRRGGRLLEFSVEAIQGEQIIITRPIDFMTHVSAIPEGSAVVEELNFVRVNRSHNVTIRGFAMDGLNRGERSGHTTFSGILVANDFHGARAAGGPLFAGLQIEDNRFSNLRGRGVAIYGTRDAVVERNQFHDMGAQAIEIDHFSSARVEANEISGAPVGIQLDDAFDTIVEQNVLEKVGRAIVFLGHFDDPWANTGNRILRNTIIGPGKVGVHLSERAHGNVVAENEFKVVQRPLEGSVGKNATRGNVIH